MKALKPVCPLCKSLNIRRRVQRIDWLCGYCGVPFASPHLKELDSPEPLPYPVEDMVQDPLFEFKKT
jgi:ribosomal protein L37AE/L43A